VLPVAPSDYEKDGKLAARALTSDEIANIQEDFLSAAIRAKKAGFDGIELHGAHGYLIDQFMSTLINKRDDAYGGSFENRARFALEIVHKIKKHTGENFIIGYRMGGNTPNLEEGIRLAKNLEENGVDLLHVSAGIRGGDLPKTPEGFPYNWIVFMGTEVKKHVSIPVVTVNDIRTPERASYLIENNLVDLAAIGRGHLVDASWAEKAENNEEVISCLKCQKCSWFRDGRLCPRNREN
jgi:2,4-dienoyl-CoA reductase-like NADH-dependent reductase (Old Yellow Enzyme family)